MSSKRQRHVTDFFQSGAAKRRSATQPGSSDAEGKASPAGLHTHGSGRAEEQGAGGAGGAGAQHAAHAGDPAGSAGHHAASEEVQGAAAAAAAMTTAAAAACPSTACLLEPDMLVPLSGAEMHQAEASRARMETRAAGVRPDAKASGACSKGSEAVGSRPAAGVGSTGAPAAGAGSRAAKAAIGGGSDVKAAGASRAAGVGSTDAKAAGEGSTNARAAGGGRPAATAASGGSSDVKAAGASRPATNGSSDAKAAGADARAAGASSTDAKAAGVGSTAFRAAGASIPATKAATVGSSDVQAAGAAADPKSGFAPRRVYLGSAADDCWLEEGRVPSHLAAQGEAFEELWDLHPPERARVRMMGKDLEAQRWHQSYLRAYTFTGVSHEGRDLPQQLQPFLEWANALPCVQAYSGKGGFNGVLVNWYQNGNDYMGPHADNESQLVPRAPILSISLGQERTFRVTHRSGAAVYKRDFSMPHGTFLIMGGNMQKLYKHAVPKVGGRKGEGLSRRINITFRVFKQ